MGYSDDISSIMALNKAMDWSGPIDPKATAAGSSAYLDFSLEELAMMQDMLVASAKKRDASDSDSDSDSSDSDSDGAGAMGKTGPAAADGADTSVAAAAGRISRSGSWELAMGDDPAFDFDRMRGGQQPDSVCITDRMTDPYGVLMWAFQHSISYAWIQESLVNEWWKNTPTCTHALSGINGFIFDLKKHSVQLKPRNSAGKIVKRHPSYTFGQHLFDCAHHNQKCSSSRRQRYVSGLLEEDHYFDLKRTTLKDQVTENLSIFTGCLLRKISM